MDIYTYLGHSTQSVHALEHCVNVRFDGNDSSVLQVFTQTLYREQSELVARNSRDGYG